MTPLYCLGHKLFFLLLVISREDSWAARILLSLWVSGLSSLSLEDQEEDPPIFKSHF